MTTIEEIQKMGTTMNEILGLTGSAVGVRLLTTDEPVPDAVPATGHRYCQALMRARHGDHVIVDAMTISCPAAARAFGFRPLPAALESGKGLVGFGITAEEAVEGPCSSRCRCWSPARSDRSTSSPSIRPDQSRTSWSSRTKSNG